MVCGGWVGGIRWCVCGGVKGEGRKGGRGREGREGGDGGERRVGF